MSDAYRDKIDSLSITTAAQANGYRRALALWDARHPKPAESRERSNA